MTKSREIVTFLSSFFAFLPVFSDELRCSREISPVSSFSGLSSSSTVVSFEPDFFAILFLGPEELSSSSSFQREHFAGAESLPAGPFWAFALSLNC